MTKSLINPLVFPLLRIAAAAVAIATCSCVSNDQFQDRMDRRNDAYRGYNERRQSRLDARQERTDMWFDRVMH